MATVVAFGSSVGTASAAPAARGWPDNTETVLICTAACVAGAAVGFVRGGPRGAALGCADAGQACVDYLTPPPAPSRPPSRPYSDARDVGNYNGDIAPTPTGPTDSEDYGHLFHGGGQSSDNDAARTDGGSPDGDAADREAEALEYGGGDFGGGGDYGGGDYGDYGDYGGDYGDYGGDYGVGGGDYGGGGGGRDEGYYQVAAT